MSEIDEIRKYVSKKISVLYSTKDTSGGKVQLANLRKGIGKTPGELPELWGIFLNELPEKLQSRNGEPSYAEWAIYLSLTMYALHQQGNSDNVHVKDISLGKASYLLVKKALDDECSKEKEKEKEEAERNRVLRRFAPIVSAKDLYEFSNHLRSMINIFKANEICIDYERLAGDIYCFQFKEQRKKVLLRWGQDFYYNYKGEDLL